MNELNAKIWLIPGEDGWEDSDNYSVFQDAAERLKALGMQDNEIVEVLASLYWAVAGEYGA